MFLTINTRYFIGELLKLGNEESVQIMGVGIEPLCQLQRGVEMMLLKTGKMFFYFFISTLNIIKLCRTLFTCTLTIAWV